MDRVSSFLGHEAVRLSIEYISLASKTVQLSARFQSELVSCPMADNKQYIRSVWLWVAWLQEQSKAGGAHIRRVCRKTVGTGKLASPRHMPTVWPGGPIPNVTIHLLPLEGERNMLRISAAPALTFPPRDSLYTNYIGFTKVVRREAAVV